jgi:pyridoxamine 5'-phosphate oxidase-like protein
VIVTAELAAFLRLGVAIVLATRDDELRPEVTRGWGPLAGEDGTDVSLCVAAAPGSATLANLKANGAIAATFSLPTSYRSVQVKGEALELGEPALEQVARVEEHVAAFVEQVEQVGIPREMARRFVDPELVAVRFAVRELFDQTPGPRAGGLL